LAVKDEHASLTYSQLKERASAAAAGLSAVGVQPGERVALCLGNSVDFVNVTLGCLWLGAAFVPLSPDDPPARLERILNDCEPRVIVSTSAATPPIKSRKRQVLEAPALFDSGRSAVERSIDPERDVYLVYTSGTTGGPKGVRISARAFGWAVSVTASSVGLGPTTRSLCVSPFHFDGSYSNLFPTLAAGGAAIITSRDKLLFVKRFFSVVLDEGITHTSFSPSYLRLVLASPKRSSLADSALRTLGLGGEEILADDLSRLWDVLPGLRVFNYYGPTESTIQVTSFEIGQDVLGSGEVPIGGPHAGVTFSLVAEDGQLVEGPGVGELYIGGRQLMSGYWRDDALTAEVLRPDITPGRVLYKTGDLVRRKEDGRFVYVGRCDDVVKRRGLRISLDEIARALRKGHVIAALCLPVELDGDLGVAAFVVTDASLTSAEILATAAERIPNNMLPDLIVVVDSMPMTSSSKVDRRALLESSGLTEWGRSHRRSVATASRAEEMEQG
jgi:amino acid adenylation domain-containing protein